MNAPNQPSQDDCFQSTKAVFADNAIRCTRPRVIIYEALRASEVHPTAEELHAAVRESDPGISLATIYNTLELLVDNGLARRIANRSQGSGSSRYDADQSPHLHLVLNNGTVLDAPKKLSKQLTDAIPEGLMKKLAKHAGVSDLKIEFVEESPAHQH